MNHVVLTCLQMPNEFVEAEHIAVGIHIYMDFRSCRGILALHVWGDAIFYKQLH